MFFTASLQCRFSSGKSIRSLNGDMISGVTTGNTDAVGKSTAAVRRSGVLVKKQKEELIQTKRRGKSKYIFAFQNL